VSTATLAGNRCTHARVEIPAHGIWYASATLDAEVTLAGRVELKIADLALSGTILSGGPAKGKSTYRIVGGAGGWGKVIPARSYTNDAGVKVSTVLTDAARDCGEALGTLPTTRLGPGFTRAEDVASRVLESVSPGAWYVDSAGVTQIGRRPEVALAVTAQLGPLDAASGKQTVAAESIASILPGVTVEGRVALDVAHEVTPAGLRSHLWSSSPTDAFRRLVLAALPDYKYRGGPFEFRVGRQTGERFDLQPVRSSLGFPELRNVPARPGIPGARADVKKGSKVLVGFIDADRSRPVVLAYEDADGGGFVPSVLELGDAGGRVLRDGDAIAVSGTWTPGGPIVLGTITLHPTMVLEGAPGVGYSRVKA
jgi:hypothetical protein